MPNRRITDLTESTMTTSSYYMTVYDPNETSDIQPDGYIDYNKKIALKNFANLPSQSALTWYGNRGRWRFYINWKCHLYYYKRPRSIGKKL
jgi:hypothetical protein